MSNDPGNDFQKGCQQQQDKAANEKPGHPRSPAAFGDQREKQRNKPQKKCKFKNHWRGLYN
jgi:hypothetical protein